MAENTTLRQRVPCDVILRVEDYGECGSRKFEAEETRHGEGVFSDLSAELTRRVLVEDTVSRREMSKEAMVAVVRRLLA
jgi:hypothetical protein